MRFLPSTASLALLLSATTLQAQVADPLESTYLKANTFPNLNELYGSSVAASGQRVLVGADRKDSFGAAYLYFRSPTAWLYDATLLASNPGPLDRFGAAVALVGTRVVVGAPEEDSSSDLVNGDGTDNSTTDAGAAYVFDRVGTTWTQTAYLKAANSDPGHRFGEAVSLDQDLVLVGSPRENTGGSEAGAAYAFAFDGSAWTQQAQLVAEHPDAGDRFGVSVAVSGTTAVVGAPREDGSSTGLNGDATDNSSNDAGAVYVFERTGSQWSQAHYIKSSNSETGDRFGQVVVLADDTLAVSAPFEDSNSTTIDSGQNNNAQTQTGAVYVFRRTGSTWIEEAYIKAPNSDFGDRFGTSLALDEDTLVVGVPREDTAASTVDAPSNEAAQDSGAAYVYSRVGTTWTFQSFLKASNADPDDRFGESVAVAGSLAVAGAPGESSGSKGINADSSGNNTFDAGAAYLFEGVSPTSYCVAKQSSEGCLPAMVASGQPSLSLSNGFLVGAQFVVPKKNGLFFYGLNGTAALPFEGGTLCVFPPLARTPIQNSGGLTGVPCDGTFAFDFNAWIQGGFDPLVQLGSEVHGQYWFRDPANAEGVGLSNGIQFTVGL